MRAGSRNRAPARSASGSPPHSAMCSARVRPVSIRRTSSAPSGSMASAPRLPMYETWNQMLSSARMPITVRSLFRRNARALQSRDGDKAGHHAGGTVEIAAVRDRVEMRADNHALRICVAAGQCHVKVGRGVMLDAQAELLRNRGNRRMRALFARTIRVARYARFVETVAAKLVEQRCRQFTLCRNCCARSMVTPIVIARSEATKQSRSSNARTEARRLFSSSVTEIASSLRSSQ